MNRSAQYIEHRLAQIIKRAAEERQGEQDHIISAWWGEIESRVEALRDELVRLLK